MAVAGLTSTEAEAAGRHTAHVTVRRTATAGATARATRTATVTGTATVGGYTASATGHGSATQQVTLTATASATARATASAASAATARARARRAAATRATSRAKAAARKTAAQRAEAKAASLASQRARQRAQEAAQQQATLLATKRANVASGASSPPQQLVGGNPPVTTTAGTSGATQGTPVTVGVSDGPGALGTSVGVTLGGTTLSVSAGVGPCGGQTPAKPGGGTWTCSFDDEFDGTSLDRTKWDVQTTAASGFAPGGACYVDDPSTVSVSGGVLHLTVRKQAAATCDSPFGAFVTDYTAGEVSTLNTFSQTYGRFEVRAELPAATVAGLQETFWLWPQNDLTYGAWPGSGEIDFAEFYSQYPSWVIPYIHYDYDQPADWSTNTNVVTALPGAYAQPGTDCRIDQSAFNTYTVTWLPGQISIEVNGNDCIVDNYVASNGGTAPFDQPFFLALTQLLGTGSNAPTADTPLPATTQVDYVRAWR